MKRLDLVNAGDRNRRNARVFVEKLTDQNVGVEKWLSIHSTSFMAYGLRRYNRKSRKNCGKRRKTFCISGVLYGPCVNSV